MKDIVIKSNETNLNSITNEKKWIKMCPKCEKEQTYKSEKLLNRAINKNSPCLSCSLIGKKVSQETREKLRKIFTGFKHTEEAKRKISISSKNMSKETRNKISIKNKGRISPQLGKPRSEETKLKISNSLRNLPDEIKQKIIDGNKNRGCSEETKLKMRLTAQNRPAETKLKIIENIKNRKVSYETRRKMRISAINRIQKAKFYGGQLTPSFNIEACKYFDELNNEKGWNLQHAMNGGEYHIKELGYWPDAYDKEKNIVVEYDEPHHYWGMRKEKDMNRLNEIKNYLGCRFLRYNKQSNKLEEC